MWKMNGKFVMELLGALVMAGIVTYQHVNADLHVSMGEWVMVVIALFGAVNVWAAANVTNWDKAKTVVSAVFVVLNLVVGFLTDNQLTSDEIMLLVVQFLSTLGVAAAPAPKHVVERVVTKA
jgi:predicted ferric reductase